MKKKITLKIEILESDYKILNHYGFMFEKNINIYLNEIANELRQAEKRKETPIKA